MSIELTHTPHAEAEGALRLIYALCHDSLHGERLFHCVAKNTLDLLPLRHVDSVGCCTTWMEVTDAQYKDVLEDILQGRLTMHPGDQALQRLAQQAYRRVGQEKHQKAAPSPSLWDLVFLWMVGCWVVMGAWFIGGWGRPFDYYVDTQPVLRAAMVAVTLCVCLHGIVRKIIQLWKRKQERTPK